MPRRPAGRPKATYPRDVKVTVRLTENEADQLQRLARNDSLSQAIRMALTSYISMMGGLGGRPLPDTERARIRRELRKAKRAGRTEDATLVQNFDLDEPTVEAPPAPRAHPRTERTEEPKSIQVAVSKVPTEERTVQVAVSKVPTEERTVQVAVHKVPAGEHRRQHA